MQNIRKIQRAQIPIADGKHARVQADVHGFTGTLQSRAKGPSEFVELIPGV